MIRIRRIQGSVTIIGAFVLALVACIETVALTTDYIFIEKSRIADASETAAVAAGVYDGFSSYTNGDDLTLVNDVADLYLSRAFAPVGSIRKEGTSSYRVSYSAPYTGITQHLFPSLNQTQVVQDSAKVSFQAPSNSGQSTTIPPMDIVIAIDYAKGYGRSRTAHDLNIDVIKKYLDSRYSGKSNLGGEHVSIIPFTNRVYDPNYGCLSNVVLNPRTSHGFSDLHVNDWYNSGMNGNNPFGGWNEGLANSYLSRQYPNDPAKRTMILNEFRNNFSLFSRLSMGSGSNVSEIPLHISDVDVDATFNKLEILDPSQKSKFGTNVISTISPRRSILAAFNSCYLSSDHLMPHLNITNKSSLDSAINQLPNSFSDGAALQFEGILRGAQVLLHPELGGHLRRKLLIVFSPGRSTHSGEALNQFFIGNQLCKRITEKVKARPDIDYFSFLMADTSTRQGGATLGSCMRSQVGAGSVRAVDSSSSLQALIDGNGPNNSPSSSSGITPKLVPRI